MATGPVLLLGLVCGTSALPVDVGEPLYITPLIRAGKLEEARHKSRVVGAPDGPDMGEAGFLTTDEETGKNMFYWYFEAQSGNKQAPLLVWLQGGPGGSSLFGLFSEMGPFALDPLLHLVARNSTWNKDYAMLFIDNPVGAGFSHTTDPEGYCKDTKQCVASNLYSLLKQFYQLHAELQSLPLYITGESYGGHYVPGIGAYIVRENQKAGSDSGFVIPLAGIAVGDGWIDPVKQIAAYPEMMFGQGMISLAQKATIQSYCDRAIEKILVNDMTGAFDVWDKMLNGDIWPYKNLFHNMTGSNDYDNFLNTNAPASFDYYSKYVNQPSVRKMLHVGSLPFPNNPHECEMNLLADFMVPFMDCLTTILEAGLPVLLYSGQLDVIIGAATTEAFLPDIVWGGAGAFAAAERAVWRITDSDPDVAGYVQSGGNLTYAMVKGAGHIAPYDQPARTLDMIQRFVDGKPFPNLPDPAKPS